MAHAMPHVRAPRARHAIAALERVPGFALDIALDSRGGMWRPADVTEVSEGVEPGLRGSCSALRTVRRPHPVHHGSPA